jgi:hypothetical protein
MTTITIPKKLIREKDLILVPRKEYEHLLSIFKIIPKDQFWFWTKEWQEKEKEADESLKKGEYKEFKDVKDLIKDIHR